MINLQTFDEFILESAQAAFSLWFPRKKKNFSDGSVFTTEIAGKWYSRLCIPTLAYPNWAEQSTGIKSIVCSPEFRADLRRGVPEGTWFGDNPWEFVRILSGDHKGLCWIESNGEKWSNKPGTYIFTAKKGGKSTQIILPINSVNTVDGQGPSAGMKFDIKAIFNELLKETA